MEWIKGIDFDGRDTFDTQPRKNFTYYDIYSDNEVRVGGWYRHHDYFSVMVTPQAGHMVPMTEPYMSMMHVKSMMEHGHLICENEDDLGCHSFASSMLSAMDNCGDHGSGSLSTGKCTCDAGWFGADCATWVNDLVDLESDSKTLVGSRWYYYKVPSSDSFSVQISSDQALEVYVRGGLEAIPDFWEFDFLAKNQKSVKLTQDSMDFSEGAIIAVHVTGRFADVTTNFDISYSVNAAGVFSAHYLGLE